MDPSRTLDPAELLAQVTWVRRLARALVRDAHAAEDLTQETLRVTLEQPAGRVGGGAALRAWLRRVARRLALDRFRSDVSRVERERAIASHEPSGEAALDVVARSQLQQRVVDAVHLLAEPYRATILLRFLDELPTREIARRMDVSDDVVRKRLERGLAQLRERLDREFGQGTGSWAALLLAWPGVVAVTMKTKVALSAALLIAAAVTWKTLGDAPTRAAPEGAPRVAASSAPEGASAATAAATAEGEGAAQRRPESAPPRDGVVAASGGVRVRVVGPQGAPLTSGRLACAWLEETGFRSPARARQFEVAIAGATTDVELPRGARSCELRAPVPGLPASPRVVVAELSNDGTRREVTIAVGDRPAEPRLSGRILVDGKCESPRGLRVRADPTNDDARVHLLDGRYEIGPLAAPTVTLVVTSDETVPSEVAATAGRGDVDVELTRGRTLELTVLDGATGAPLPRFELYVTASAPTRREPPFRELWREGSRFVVTGEGGVAVVRGIPRRGIVAVRRDASVRRAERPFLVGNSFNIETLREPLLDLPVDESMPDVVERTLRIDAEVVVRTVRGRLAPQLRIDPAGAPDATPPLEVRWARVDVGEKGRRPDGIARLGNDEAFSFAVDAAGDYRVWAERDRLRVSDVAAVAVAAADPDPFELRARPGGEITLRLTHVPAKGFVHLYVNDPGAVYDQAVVLPATGADVERRLALDGPTWVMAGWYPERGASLGQSQRREVDPATTPRVEIDLGGDRQRKVELSFSIGAPPPLAQVALFRKEKPHDLPLGIVFKGGASDGEVAVEAGTYIGFVMGARGVVAGEVTLADGPRDEPLRLHFKVEEHKKADLGAGIELVRIGTFELEAALRKATALRFDRRTDLAQEESILLPVGAEWTILTK